MYVFVYVYMYTYIYEERDRNLLLIQAHPGQKAIKVAMPEVHRLNSMF